MAGPHKETQHGTMSCRKYRGCNRPECVQAANAYEARRHRLIGYGKWNPLVDAEPARKHLKMLNSAGCSYASIAATLGRYKAAVTTIVFPQGSKAPTKRIRPEFSAAILALTIEDVRPPRVDATGTKRRIRALNLIGWPTTIISERIGREGTRISHIHLQKQVRRETAQAIKDCYDTLKDLNPTDHGINPHTSLTVAGKARAHGARDPLWWEDWGHIDDPGFDPDTAEQELNRKQLGALRRQEIEHLLSYGCPEEQIAERIGLQHGTVRDVVAELRAGQRRDRRAAS
jgi:hypothetical protein